MIPTYDIQPNVPAAVPACKLPGRDEVSEEGFGYFRGTWLIGRLPVSEAEQMVGREQGILRWLDDAAGNPSEFELLARAIEWGDTADGSGSLEAELDIAATFREDDFSPLNGLEVGVAGLVYTLNAIGCLTAASCRAHASDRSWAPCPVVFFAAPTWRVAVLLDLIQREGCGLSEDRDMLVIDAPSVRQTHGLARAILEERRRFRTIPAGWRRPRSLPRQSAGEQLPLEDGASAPSKPDHEG